MGTDSPNLNIFFKPKTKMVNFIGSSKGKLPPGKRRETAQDVLHNNEAKVDSLMQRSGEIELQKTQLISQAKEAKKKGLGINHYIQKIKLLDNQHRNVIQQMKLAGNTANTVHKVTNMVEQAESTKQNMQLMNQAMRQTKNLIGNDPSKLALKAMMMSEKMEMYDETMNERHEAINPDEEEEVDIDALLGAEYDGNANPIGNEVPLEANVDTSPSFAATGQNQNRNLQMEPAVMEVDEFGIPR